MQPFLLDMSMNLKKLLTTVVFALGASMSAGAQATNYDFTLFYYVTTNGKVPGTEYTINGKVGFLLGCLFLMFGRKKQSTEPMLAVSTI